MIPSFTIEKYVTTYLGTTWMDTIVYGIPILSALFDSSVGSIYPVLASISSFIFQLPFMLIIFELGVAVREREQYSYVLIN